MSNALPGNRSLPFLGSFNKTVPGLVWIAEKEDREKEKKRRRLSRVVCIRLMAGEGVEGFVVVFLGAGDRGGCGNESRGGGGGVLFLFSI